MLYSLYSKLLPQAFIISFYKDYKIYYNSNYNLDFYDKLKVVNKSFITGITYPVSFPCLIWYTRNKNLR